MSGTTWSKFYWADWESDEKLKLCSPAAQALWMRMLCICAKTGGYLVVEGHKLGPDEMAAITGWPVRDVRRWWAELAKWGVFSVEGRGKVYSRKMVKDGRKPDTARENGKNGGNPNLRKGSTSVASDNRQPTNHPTYPPGRSPETRIQKEREDADASLSDRPVPTPKPRLTPTKAELDAIWDETPRLGRERSSRKDLERAVGASMRRGHAPTQMRLGVRAAYASSTYSGDHAKGVHRLIEADRWLSFLEPEAGPQQIVEWDGPADLLDAIRAETDDRFITAYILPNRWLNGPDRLIICQTEYAAQMIRQRAPESLRQFGANAISEGSR